MQSPAVRQQLLHLHAMDFLIQQVSLEAELQMNVSVPLSSTATTAPTDSPGLQSASAQPSSCSVRTSALRQTSQPDAAPGIHNATVSSMEAQPQRASYRSSSSRLRLPALPPVSARSPRISARYPGLPANGVAPKVAQPSLDGLRMPAGFVSTGDLEEDTQQLLEMDSQVHSSLSLLHKSLRSCCTIACLPFYCYSVQLASCLTHASVLVIYTP